MQNKTEKQKLKNKKQNKILQTGNKKAKPKTFFKTEIENKTKQNI